MLLTSKLWPWAVPGLQTEDTVDTPASAGDPVHTNVNTFHRTLRKQEEERRVPR